MAYRRTEAVLARAEAVRERVLTAATEIVAEEGYAGVSVQGVAMRADVATGSVYRHFETKAALLTEVFRRATARELEAVQEAAEAEGTVWQRLEQVVTVFARRALRSRRLAYALLVEPVDPAVEQERLAFRRAYRDVLAAMLDQAVSRREIPRQNTVTTAAALVGAIGEALVGPLSPAGESARAVVPALVSFCVRAVGDPLEPAKEKP